MNTSNWRRSVWLLALLLLFMQSFYLHRMPGLFGDEASEGLNVYQILTGESLFTILGERSYIGPLIDYVRIPFVAVFGYTALALRIPMVILSMCTFILAARIFRRFVDEKTSLIMLSLLFFSPIYLLYQRLGWAVTLFPFFASLLLYTLICYEGRHKPLIVGLVAGLGLHNYITFFPTIAGILGATLLGYVVYHPRAWRQWQAGLATWWPLLAGFWATFGTQFGVLNLYQEDQGDPWAVAANVWDRIADLPHALPQLLSGAVYMASYGSPVLSPTVMFGIVAILVALVAWALITPPSRAFAWIWLTGVVIQLTVLLIMVDRFTLRYFVIFNLGVWALAGLGLAKVVARLMPEKTRSLPFSNLLPALILSAFIMHTAFIPFLQTGGQWRYFSLDDPRSPAEIKVDIIPLITCLHGKALIYSDDVHILNRLMYLQQSDPQLFLASGKDNAQWIIRHRQPNRPQRTADEACPALTNFTVLPAE